MKSIEQLKKKDLNCNIFSVYDYDGLTITELLCQFFTKINECIDTSNETIDLAKWLVNEGLEIEVAKTLVMWLEDGTLENIISVNLFNSLNEKINGLSSQLEQIAINVKNFGAKGDGLNDDTEAINNAINFAYSNDFKKVYFPYGEYLINSSLTLKGDLVYEGNNSILKQTKETSYISISENNFEIKGLIFDGNSVIMRTLYINGSSNFKIKDCAFKNTTKYGLHIYRGKKGKVENCNFINAGRNDFMSSGLCINGSDIDIVYCETSGNLLGNGFLTYSDNSYTSQNIRFLSCLAKNNKQHGFITCHHESVGNRLENISFIDCTANGNGQISESEYMYGGIVMHDANNSIISNCICLNNYEHGIAIMDSDNISAVNNISRSNKRCGIRLQADWSRLPEDVYSGVKKCLIANNQCLNNGIEDNYWSSGILIEGNCHYITCSSNIINGNYYSIYTKDMANFSDCTNIYLQDNVMYGNKVSNNWFNTMRGGSVFGENFISGVRTKIDTVLNEQAGYVAYDITDKLVGGKLDVVNNAMYHITSGNVVINGVIDTNMKVGTTFYICLKTGSNQHSITVNNGNGINLPSSLVISKENKNNELIFKFVKTSGTGFRLLQ